MGLITKEKPLLAYDGLIYGNRIAIRNQLTEIKKKCVLAEELGHYHTTAGNILDQSEPGNRKQELRARLWAHNKLIGLSGLIRAYLHGCQSIFELAEYLGVTEEFVLEAVSFYKSKYGNCARHDRYLIFFEPLSVLEIYQ